MSNQTRFRFFLATPTQEYSGQTLRKYLYSAKSSQELAPAKKYLVSYFARSDIGVYKWFPKNQVFKHYPRKVAEESFIQKDVVQFRDDEGKVLDVFDIQAWFFRNTPFFIPQVNPFQPKIYRGTDGGYYINEFAGFLHPNPPPFQEFSQAVRNQVKLIINHIEEVLCSSDKKQAYYMKNLVMRIAVGQKMQKTMFLHSGPGTGKSMLTWFLRERVLGPKITMKTANERIITGQFNKELEGKCLLILEEMSNSKSTDWITFANRLKDFVDSDTLMIEEKYRTPYPVANITNLIINSNNSKTIRLDRDDRRYFIPDISEKYVKNGIGMDHYYAPLDSAIKDPEVGKAFYSYALEYVKLNPDFDERKIPITATKLMMVNRDNNKVHEFIKENYVVQHRGLDISSSMLYHDFKAWFAEYTSSKKRPFTVQEFTRALGELGLKAKQKRIGDRKASKRLQWYSATYTDLYTIFMKKNMIDEAENIEVPEGYQESEVLIEIPSERLPEPVPKPVPEPKSESDSALKESPKSIKMLDNLMAEIDGFISELNVSVPEPVPKPMPEPEPALKEPEPIPYGIPGPSNTDPVAKPMPEPESPKPIQKVDPDPMPKFDTAEYWEWMDRHGLDDMKWSHASAIDALYNTAQKCWAKYIDKDDPYDWDMLLTELEEFDKMEDRDGPYLVQFGNAINKLKEKIPYIELCGNSNKHITCQELIKYLKNYIKYKETAPPSGYRFAELQPQKINAMVINERECMLAMGEEDESDYDEDGLIEAIDRA